MKRWLQRMLDEDAGDMVSLPWMLQAAHGGRSYMTPESAAASLEAIDELAAYKFDVWDHVDGYLSQEDALERWREAVRSGPDTIYDTLFTGPFLILDKMPDWWHDLPPLEDDEDESSVQPLT